MRVIDCSFSAALFLPDECSLKVRDYFSTLPVNEEIVVPSIWWYELTNVLTVSVRRGRLRHSDVINVMALFEQLELETDKSIGIEHSKEVYKVAQLYQLSAYDAAYLELALRRNASLASLDEQLVKAAINSGISVFNVY